MPREFDANYLNGLFTDALTENDNTKIASAGELYLRTRIREAPFSRKILPAVPVTKEDCQRSLNDDTLVIMKDIAPNAQAVTLTFRGKPNQEYITGKRFEIPFYKISSKLYSKTEAELLAYEMPIVTLFEEDIVKVMMKVEDVNFILQCADAVVQNGNATYVGSSDGKIHKEHLITLFNMLDGNELEAATVLMSKTTWNDWSGQGSEVFDIGAWDVARFGYKEETILGRKVIITLKEDLIPHNHVWAFTEPKYLGYSFILEDAKFWVDRKAEDLFFKGWEYLGVGIGNIKAIAFIKIIPEASIPTAPQLTADIIVPAQPDYIG